jgi:hypothetical protein
VVCSLVYQLIDLMWAVWCRGEYILQHNLWDKKMEVKWNVMNVYVAPHDKDKELFLVEMAKMCFLSKDPL